MREIQVFTKMINADGKKFPVHSTKINGVYYKIKFTQEVENKPNKVGVSVINVDEKYISIQDNLHYVSKDGELKKATSVIWVRKIDKIRELTEDENAELNKDKIKAIWG